MKVILVLVLLAVGCYASTFTVQTCVNGDQKYLHDRLICLTDADDKQPSSDLTSARGLCASYGGCLCTLDDLIIPYTYGARLSAWALVDAPHRDARLTVCRSDYIDRGECLYQNKGIMNTPRANAFAFAYCCKERDV